MVMKMKKEKHTRKKRKKRKKNIRPTSQFTSINKRSHI